jgi:hypothetical protein
MRIIRSMRLWLLAVVMLGVTSAALAEVSIGVSVRVGPPAIPVYTQPICPGPNYIWTPGYWAYEPAGYYWVPGTWVLAPSPGLLWTPGYWGWGGEGYIWHEGYWGPHVGFYGGINYGFGYVGVGYVGGRWDRGVFHYNTAVTRINTTVIHTTYVDRTVIRNVTVNRVSYNGGNGGLRARPNAGEETAFRERRMAATSEQARHEHYAANNRAFLASENHGRPPVAATPRPGEFNRGTAARPTTMHAVAPRAEGNPHNVPRPYSQPERMNARSSHPANYNGAQSNGLRNEARPHEQSSQHREAPQNQRGGDRHESGNRHQGGDRHEDGRPH